MPTGTRDEPCASIRYHLHLGQCSLVHSHMLCVLTILLLLSCELLASHDRPDEVYCIPHSLSRIAAVRRSDVHGYHWRRFFTVPIRRRVGKGSVQLDLYLRRKSERSPASRSRMLRVTAIHRSSYAHLFPVTNIEVL